MIKSINKSIILVKSAAIHSLIDIVVIKHISPYFLLLLLLLLLLFLIIFSLVFWHWDFLIIFLSIIKSLILNINLTFLFYMFLINVVMINTTIIISIGLKSTTIMILWESVVHLILILSFVVCVIELALQLPLVLIHILWEILILESVHYLIKW